MALNNIVYNQIAGYKIKENNVTRGQFYKTKLPKFVLQNAKIFLAFSMFNFIKALTPKFLRHNAKNPYSGYITGII